MKITLGEAFLLSAKGQNGLNQRSNAQSEDVFCLVYAAQVAFSYLNAWDQKCFRLQISEFSHTHFHYVMRYLEDETCRLGNFIQYFLMIWCMKTNFMVWNFLLVVACQYSDFQILDFWFKHAELAF
jgi:hypothetical protein